MESEPKSEDGDARRTLLDAESIRARAARMPRSHAALQLAYTVLLAAYMAVFVFTGSAEGGASAFGGTTMTLALPPIIVSSALVSGANERFRERLSATPRYWIAVGFFALILVTLLIWGIAGGGYPWWVALIAFAITLLIFGIRPLRVVLSAPAVADAGETRPRTLPVPAKLMTASLGLFFGLACAVVLVPALAWIVMMLGLGVVLVGLSARTAPGGLLRTGYEWRWAQWAGFGVAALLMFVLAVLIIATDLVTAPIAAGAGAVVAASLIVSAFIPGRGRVSPPA